MRCLMYRKIWSCNFIVVGGRCCKIENYVEVLEVLIDMTKNDSVSETLDDKIDQNQGEKIERNKDTTPCSATS